jgi:hypothetical protein
MSQYDDEFRRSRPSPEGSVTSDVRRSAEDVAETARSAGERVISSVREEAGSAAESGKEMAASRLDHIVSALYASADELQRRDDRLASGVQGIAEQVQAAVRHLRNQDLEGLSSELSDFARHNPGAFLGGAAILGFAISRLATTPSRRGAEGFEEYRGSEGGSI